MNHKKAVRAAFRKAVFDRDGHRCRMCGWKPKQGDDGLDAHHITDRNLLPSGGYVAQNGISLCAGCHILAEKFHSTGTAHPGYSVEDLYGVIGSSFEEAFEASQKLE